MPGGQHPGAELDEGLAKGRHRHGDARGEHRAGKRQRGPEHQVAKVPASPLPARLAPHPRTGRQRLQQPRPAPAGSASGAAVGGEGRGGADLRPDALKAIGAGLHLLRGGMQRRAHKLREVMWLTGWWPGSHVYSCSNAALSAAMPRAVWLLTAPRLIRMAVAISASERSA
jgi:hypothetical protein